MSGLPELRIEVGAEGDKDRGDPRVIALRGQMQRGLAKRPLGSRERRPARE